MSMYIMRINSYKLILYIYLILLFIPLFGVNIFDYNPIIDGVFLVIILVHIRLKTINVFIILFFLLLFYIIFLSNTSSGPLYAVFTIIKLLIPILLIYKSKVINFQILELFYLVAKLFIFSNILLAILNLSQLNIDGFRFFGTINNVNLTTNLTIIFIIYIIEYNYSVKNKENLSFILMYFLIFLFFMLVTGTRSGILALLYFFYVLHRTTKNRKSYYILLLPTFLLIFFVFYSTWPLIQEKLRLSTGNDSLITRYLIYEYFWLSLIDNYFLIPFGIHAHKHIMAVNFNNYPVHNDYLEYVYNLGFLFLAYLGYIIYIIKKSSGVLTLCFSIILLIIVSSFALHNELLSVFIWIPLSFILYIKKYPLNNNHANN